MDDKKFKKFLIKFLDKMNFIDKKIVLNNFFDFVDIYFNTSSGTLY